MNIVEEHRLMSNKEIAELREDVAELKAAISEIKKNLDEAFAREQGQWKSVFEAVDMNFKEIRDYANDTFLHADTFWEYRKKDNDLN
tara:strand:- start:235 stop:495 length:261 start_codon:yes stop_codon:yes gene_type:complete